MVPPESSSGDVGSVLSSDVVEGCVVAGVSDDVEYVVGRVGGGGGASE